MMRTNETHAPRAAAIAKLELARSNANGAHMRVVQLEEELKAAKVKATQLEAAVLEAQSHKAFGAPGDFGYESVIGDALSRLHRGAVVSAPDEIDPIAALAKLRERASELRQRAAMLDGELTKRERDDAQLRVLFMQIERLLEPMVKKHSLEEQLALSGPMAAMRRLLLGAQSKAHVGAVVKLHAVSPSEPDGAA